jgi:peptide/nickel transport system ATP-binding protein
MTEVPLVAIEKLKVVFHGDRGRITHAVDTVDLDLVRGATLGIVGESGCGKSVTALAIMGLLSRTAEVSGAVRFDGIDLLELAQAELRDLRGNQLAMIFQEPMTSLNPSYTIGEQIIESLVRHRGLSRGQARTRAIELMRRVHISSPERRVDDYPHKLSGGMRQRAMIAMALACEPELLIADEPTTALDVTIQAQILDIILELQRKLGTAVILITHDLGVVAETAQRVIVMYAGRKVEEASVDELFARPLHPYTHGLMASIPRLALMRGESSRSEGRLAEIPGMVPALTNLPAGCVFAPRCAFAEDRCRGEYPPYEEKRPAHWAACWRSDALYGAADA